jgi:hypothetical protein
MQQLEALIGVRLSELQATLSPAEQAASSKGRHGPIMAGMCRRNVHGGRLQWSEDDERFEALDDYVTVRARAGVSSGVWSFETLIRSDGVLQVGWATAQCYFSDQATAPLAHPRASHRTGPASPRWGRGEAPNCDSAWGSALLLVLITCCGRTASVKRPTPSRSTADAPSCFARSRRSLLAARSASRKPQTPQNSQQSEERTPSYQC